MPEKSTLKAMIFDMLFPRRCLGCRALLAVTSAHHYVCEPCFALIRPVTESRCPFCRNATILGAICRECRPGHDLDRLLVAAFYENRMVKLLVKALKYRFAAEAAEDIGAAMAGYLDNRIPLIGIDSGAVVVIPIPLHRRRLRWRGFNQAELITRMIAAKLGIPLRTDILARLRAKLPQADIENKDERVRNARGIFDLAVGQLSAVQQLKNATVLLVDDVATTGATLDDAAHVLKQNGAKKVIGFVFARGG